MIDKPKCKYCEHCKSYYPKETIRTKNKYFYCEHPNQNYLMEKAKKLKIFKTYNFICYGKGKEITIKGCLRNCPKLENLNGGKR